MPGPFDVFLSADALSINAARLSHLASLGLDLAGKRVLEVGAGIGLHTPFFLERGCEVLATDGNAQNVEEIRRRHPGLRVEQVDLERDEDLRRLGTFDIVHCYGVLYHLAHPERALARLAQACTGQILLETCVSLGAFPEVVFLRDYRGNNQAVSGIACRPTRAWVKEALERHFGMAYFPLTQPGHPDFPEDWICPETQVLYRAIFIGSKVPLANPRLGTGIPRRQARA